MCVKGIFHEDLRKTLEIQSYIQFRKMLNHIIPKIFQMINPQSDLFYQLPTEGRSCSGENWKIHCVKESDLINGLVNGWV